MVFFLEGAKAEAKDGIGKVDISNDSINVKNTLSSHHSLELPEVQEV